MCVYLCMFACFVHLITCILMVNFEPIYFNDILKIHTKPHLFILAVNFYVCM